jgi:hypothetical protein
LMVAAAAADSAARAADTAVAVASASATVAVAVAGRLQAASSGQGSKGSVAAWDGASMVARAAAGVAVAAAAGAEDGSSLRRWGRPFGPRGQAGVTDTCRTRPGMWSARWNRKRKQRAVLRSRSTARVSRSSPRRRCPHHQHTFE